MKTANLNVECVDLTALVTLIPQVAEKYALKIGEYVTIITTGGTVYHWEWSEALQVYCRITGGVPL